MKEVHYQFREDFKVIVTELNENYFQIILYEVNNYGSIIPSEELEKEKFHVKSPMQVYGKLCEIEQMLYEKYPNLMLDYVREW